MANKIVEKLNWPVIIVSLGIGWEWFNGGWGKISEGKFVEGLSKTLGFFASKNPNLWFKDFLTSFAVPNSLIVGNMVMFGELVAGLSLFAGVLFLFLKKGEFLKWSYYLLALGFGIGLVLNVMFWLAAGWTSPSTEGVNFVMAVVEVAGLIWVATGLTKSGILS